MAEEKNKKKKSAGSKFLIFVLELVLSFIIAYVATSYLAFKEIILSVDVLFQPYFFPILGLLALAFVLLILSKALKPSSGSGDASVKYKGDKKKYYDTEWLSTKALETESKYMYHLFQDLGKTSDIGIPIRAEYSNNKLHINMYESIHTLVIGSTGSGKTTQIINPYVQIMSSLKHKPCLVIADPKGEIYRDNITHLNNNGYRTLVFDLIEPFKSTCWNPLARPYNMYKRAQTLESEIKVHRNEDPRQSKLQLAANEYYQEWYELDGIAFPNMDMVRRKMLSLKQTLETEALEELKEISSVICPIEDKNSPIWESGARDLINGILLAMLEDTMIPDTGMTEAKFNFYNMAQVANFKDNDPYNPFKTLGDYFAGRDKFSGAPQLANQVLSNAGDTKRSYMGIVADRMGLFADMGVCFATHKNEMTLENFVEKPTVLFIKVPDHKLNRHPLACMFISQLYKILVDIANTYGGKLPRQVHFLLDEFANIPKIPSFETIITVARGRNIYFTLILQSYVQLAIKYDQNIAATIEDNCNIHIYLASNDMDTKKKFSEKCGHTTVESESKSSSKGKGDDSKSSNTSVTIEQRPLIYPEELDSLKEGINIVKILKQPPLKAEFTRYYKVPLYNSKQVTDEYKEPGVLDVRAIYFDILERNKNILKKDTRSNLDFDLI